MLIWINLRELNASSGQPLMIIPKYYIIDLSRTFLSPPHELLLEALNKLLNEYSPLRPLVNTVPIHPHDLIREYIRDHVLFFQGSGLSG